MLLAIPSKWPLSDGKYCDLYNAMLKKRIRMSMISDKDVEDYYKFHSELNEID